MLICITTAVLLLLASCGGEKIKPSAAPSPTAAAPATTAPAASASQTVMPELIPGESAETPGGTAAQTAVSASQPVSSGAGGQTVGDAADDMGD